MRLQAQGISLEQYLQSPDRDPRSSPTSCARPPSEAVKVDLALRAVADAEGIEALDEDLEEEIAAVAERVNEDADTVREQLDRGGQLSAVRSDISKRKALEWLRRATSRSSTRTATPSASPS